MKASSTFSRVSLSIAVTMPIRIVRILDARKLIVLLGPGINSRGPPAFPEPRASRAEALSALAHGRRRDTRRGVVWIANAAAWRRARLLHERLRDRSLFVRSVCARVWLLWDALRRRDHRRA